MTVLIIEKPQSRWRRRNRPGQFNVSISHWLERWSLFTQLCSVPLKIYATNLALLVHPLESEGGKLFKKKKNSTVVDWTGVKLRRHTAAVCFLSAYWQYPWIKSIKGWIGHLKFVDGCKEVVYCRWLPCQTLKDWDKSILPEIGSPIGKFFKQNCLILQGLLKLFGVGHLVLLLPWCICSYWRAFHRFQRHGVSVLFDRPAVRVECGKHASVSICISKITRGGAFGRYKTGW